MIMKFYSILEIISAIILLIILFPIGVIYSLLIQPFIHFKKYNVFKYLYNFIYQIIYVIFDTFHQVAIYIDIIGNIVIGDLMEICVLKDKNIIDTWFGKKEHTISQSLGELEINGKLNKFGIFITKLASKVFEDNHCINAYNHYINKK